MLCPPNPLLLRSLAAGPRRQRRSRRFAELRRLANYSCRKIRSCTAPRGTEVKSVRNGRANLKDADGLVKDG